jgi:hypothetical protein
MRQHGATAAGSGGPPPTQQQQLQAGAANALSAIQGTLRGVAAGALASTLLGRRTSSADGGNAATPTAAASAAAGSAGRGLAAGAVGGGGAQQQGVVVGGGGGPQQQQQQQPDGALVPLSLKALMGLPAQPAGPVPERSLPAQPTKTVAGAHKGSVCSVAVMRPGEQVCVRCIIEGLQVALLQA